MHIFYLLRHAQSQPSDLPDPEWPLSELGRQQAQALIPALQRLKLTHLFSSPYPRAVDTLAPFAKAAGIEIKLDERLRERKLSTQLLDNLQELLEKSWRDFDFALPGAESSRQCQARMVECIEEHRLAHADGTCLFAGHGNAIALYLNHIDPEVNFARWQALKNPDLIVVNLKKKMYRSISV